MTPGLLLYRKNIACFQFQGVIEAFVDILERYQSIT